MVDGAIAARRKKVEGDFFQRVWNEKNEIKM